MPFSPSARRAALPQRLSDVIRAARFTRLAAAALLAAPAVAQAQGVDAAQEQRSYAIEPGPLAPALNRFAQQADLVLSFSPQLAAGKSTQGLNGVFDAQSGLRQLLAGTGLEAVSAGAGAWSLRPLPDAGGAVLLPSVKVQGRTALLEPPPETHGFKADFQESVTRTPLAIRDTPMSISVTTRESLDARQVRTLESALELTSGVAYTAIANPGAFGGQGLRHFGNGFVLRNQEISGDRDIRTDGFSTGNVSVVDMAAYERIEVLKGPSGFYGQGSVGGFINQVRRKPTAEFEGSIAAQAGSFDTWRAEGDISGPLTDSKALRGRLTMAYDDAGAFVDGVENQRLFLAPSVEALFGERTRLLLQLLYQDEKFVPNPGFPAFLDGDEIVAPRISRSLFVGVPSDKKATDEYVEASVRLDHELSDAWLASLFLQGNRVERHAAHESYAYGLTAGGDTYMYTQRAEVDQDRWSGELRLDGQFEAFGNEHQLTGGIERNRRDGTRRQGYAYLGTANIYLENFAAAGIDADIGTWRTDRTYIVDNTAFYLQSVLNLGARTKLLLGARHDRAEQKSDTYFRGAAEDTQEYAVDKTTWRAGLSQTLTENISAYASYGQSFNPLANLSRNGSILEPESGEGYEVGLKSEWFGQRLAVNLALFRQEMENRPLRDPSNAPGESFYISSGPHRSEGVELELSGSPVDGLTLGGALSHSSNEFTQSDDPYYRLAFHGTIDDQYSLYANYEWQRGWLRGVGVGATWVNVGERQYIRGTQQIHADGYDRLDLNLSYKGLPGYDVGLQVRNLFDEKYLEGTGYTGAGNYFGSPRAVLLRVEYGL